mgnify:CR=1 FL=1
MSKNLELVVVHDRPFNFLNARVPRVECSAQTDITPNIIEFITKGAQKYERLMLLGLIKPDFGI